MQYFRLIQEVQKAATKLDSFSDNLCECWSTLCVIYWKYYNIYITEILGNVKYKLQWSRHGLYPFHTHYRTSGRNMPIASSYWHQTALQSCSRFIWKKNIWQIVSEKGELYNSKCSNKNYISKLWFQMLQIMDDWISDHVNHPCFF